MKLIDREVKTKSSTDTFPLYVIGDVHIGSLNCAEKKFRQFVGYIKDKPNALWIGGGDYCDCIKPQDVKRFDHESLPDWLLTGSPTDIREALSDIVRKQKDRFCEIVEPIRDKCLGLIEGNHEYVMRRNYNYAMQYIMCEQLRVPNLTDSAFIRLRFNNNGGNARTIRIFIQHGFGGGRTPGAEPNHLARLDHMVTETDIILRGHAHSFRIEPPIVKMFVPSKGVLGDEVEERHTYLANWGCWVMSYKAGPSTYDSRAAYPPRPLEALEIMIKPCNHGHGKSVLGQRKSKQRPVITMSMCDYS